MRGSLLPLLYPLYRTRGLDYGILCEAGSFELASGLVWWRGLSCTLSGQGKHWDKTPRFRGFCYTTCCVQWADQAFRASFWLGWHQQCIARNGRMDRLNDAIRPLVWLGSPRNPSCLVFYGNSKQLSIARLACTVSVQVCQIDNMHRFITILYN